MMVFGQITIERPTALIPAVRVPPNGDAANNNSSNNSSSSKNLNNGVPGMTPFGNSPRQFYSTHPGDNEDGPGPTTPPAIPISRKTALDPAAHQGFTSSWKNKTSTKFSHNNLPHHTLLHAATGLGRVPGDNIHQQLQQQEQEHQQQRQQQQEQPFLLLDYSLDTLNHNRRHPLLRPQSSQRKRRRNIQDTTAIVEYPMHRTTATSSTGRTPLHVDDDATFSNTGGRDSHDLTFNSNNPIARESLVENMLLSLDRLGTSEFGFSQDPSVNQFFPTNDADIDFVDTDEYYDEPIDYDHQSPRSRRPSATGNGRPNYLSHINTTHQQQQPQQPQHHNYHLPNQHHHHYQHRQQLSGSQNNYLNRDKSLPSTPTQQSFLDGYAQDGHPVLNRPDTSSQGQSYLGGYNVEVYSDAAPTPTISNRSRDRAPSTKGLPPHPLSPASPSAPPVVAPLPPLPPPPPPHPTTQLERKRSNTARSYKRDKLHHATTMDDNTPASHPADSLTSSAAPNVAAKSGSGGSQRPGFFRRVFGGSNKGSTPHNATNQETTATATAATATTTIPVTATTGSSVAPPLDATSAPPIPPTTADSSAPSSRPHTVTKKASGFFRRRKKSMTEADQSQMPRTPFAQLPNQFDITENPLPSPPPAHMLQGSYSGGIVAAPVRPDTTETSAARVQTPSKQGSDSFVPNKVTTSPSNKNTDDIDRKPTIRTVAGQNIASNISSSTALEQSNDGNLSAVPSTIELRKSPSPAVSVKENNSVSAGNGNLGDPEVAQERTDTEQSLPVTPKKQIQRETESGIPIKPPRPPTPKRSYTGDSAITADSMDIPDEAGSTGGLRVAEDDGFSQRTPTRNNSTPVVVLQDIGEAGDAVVDPDATPQPKRKKDEEDEDVGEPSEEEKEMAKKIFEGDEEFVSKSRAAAWLGETGDASKRIRKAYMALFDWTNVNHLAALRMLCEKLVLKGETQQMGRILDAMTNRWLDCNPNHGFKCVDVVRTMLYSLLLLNTDLHIADIPQSSKMTRSQFIRNTMTTVRRVLVEADLTSAFPTQNLSPMRAPTPQLGDDKEDTQLSPNKSKATEGRSSLDQPRSNRLSFIRGAATIAPRLFDDLSLDSLALGSIPGLDGSGGDNGGPFVSAPFSGSNRQWEMVIEAILKDFYASVRLSALPLHGVSSDRNLDTSSNSSSLMVAGSLRRTPSTVSKAPSEMSLRTPGDRYGNVVNYARSETTPKFGSSKWGMKNRSRPRLYPSSFAGSSRTSFEDRMWSPSASSTWSKYSLDKTTPSMMSVDSLGAGFGQKDYHQSIGFANALSHAIIREEAASGSAVSLDGTESVQNVVVDEDLEDLALHGAPWAKEGLVKHKHHLESVGKKSKNRGWQECFAVIEKGCMRLFLFPSSDKKKQQQKGGLVGGGNWLENAESIGVFVLRQSIASALPPPGYSKSRPHVLALSLPNGAVHLFQVGTADIVKEWVTTANYWSARLSKEPLIGGVSNVEYGWGNCIDPALIQSSATPSRPPTSMSSRPSFQESIRSSMDHGMGGVRARLPGDKAVIGDWNPPSQSMVASNLGEREQLKALDSYVKNVETELQKHNELRSAMVLAFTPRHLNYSKAMNNWERKSSYLLREIVKFRTYIDALTTAIEMREKILSERDAEDKVLELPDAAHHEGNDLEITTEN